MEIFGRELFHISPFEIQVVDWQKGWLLEHPAYLGPPESKSLPTAMDHSFVMRGVWLNGFPPKNKYSL